MSGTMNPQRGSLCHTPNPRIQRHQRRGCGKVVRTRDQGGPQETELPGQTELMGSEQLSARDQANPRSRVEVEEAQEIGTVVGCWEREGVVLDGSTTLQ